MRKDRKNIKEQKQGKFERSKTYFVVVASASARVADNLALRFDVVDTSSAALATNVLDFTTKLTIQ